MSVVLRNGMYYLRRRVPARYHHAEQRRDIWLSLHTDSADIAKRKAKQAWDGLIASWEARLAGRSDDAERAYAAAQDLARNKGFAWIAGDKVAQLPVDELLDRVEAIEERHNIPDQTEAAAMLGTVSRPAISVSRALELYWELSREKTLKKNDDQLRRWRNPRIKAINNFIQVVGDKPIEKLTRDDLLDFREFWLERIESGEVTANSANKDFTHLGGVLKTVNTMKRLGLDLPLGDLAFKEGEAKTRPPFSRQWIRTHLLAPDALDGLNPEARAILLGMINTGYRPSEGAALTADRIRLDHGVPHISIEPETRELKTQHSRRIIPLLGVSLEAFKQFPDGFERYKNSASLSATVNKYLRINGLMETPHHVMYSLRHSFEDRMLEAGVDERIRADLMGHKLKRERYGSGASLEHLVKVLEPIVL